VIADGRLVALGAIDALGGVQARVPIVRWIADGAAHEERTERPGELVARLSTHGEPERLEVIRPSLEDIYLSLVGSPEGSVA
jgi:ABC-2 type transport system ATP-binding protein